MTRRKKNTNRIAVSCTLAAVIAIGAADWAWGQGAGASGTGPGLSPAGSQSQRNEPQSLNTTDQPQTTAGQGTTPPSNLRPPSTTPLQNTPQLNEQRGTQSSQLQSPLMQDRTQRRSAATGSITTEAIMQSRQNSMDQRTGYRGLEPKPPRSRAILRIDLDLRYPATAIVTKVYPGSGAEEAGLRAGDMIVGIDNIPVTSAEDVIRVIADTDPNQAISVAYMRRATTTVHLRPRNPAAADSLSQHGLPPATPRPGSTATRIANPSNPPATPQTQTGAASDSLPTDPLNREIEQQLRQLDNPPEKP